MRMRVVADAVRAVRVIAAVLAGAGQIAVYGQACGKLSFRAGEFGAGEDAAADSSRNGRGQNRKCEEAHA